MMGLSAHQKNGGHDEWLTPPEILRALGAFDLDPCAPVVRPWETAAQHYTAQDDGLALPWNGSVFLNWPYSNPLPWASKLRAELAAGRCTSAIVLAKLDTSTEWWRVLVDDASIEQWQFRCRVLFGEPPKLIAARVQKYAELGKPGGEKSSTNFCSVIIHFRGDTAPLALDEFADRWVRTA